MVDDVTTAEMVSRRIQANAEGKLVQKPAFGPELFSPPAAAPEHIVQFFAFGHLPPHLQDVSRPFGELADLIVKIVPRNPERTVALRKLLEAKDAAVRALVAK